MRTKKKAPMPAHGMGRHGGKKRVHFVDAFFDGFRGEVMRPQSRHISTVYLP